MKTYVATPIIFLIVGSHASCANTPEAIYHRQAGHYAYVPRGEDNQGYTESQVDQNVWIVSYAGERGDPSPQAADLALMRCSEVALANHFQYFVISSRDDSERSAHFFQKAPATSYTITCFEQRPVNVSTTIYNAKITYESLAKQYGFIK